MEQMFKSMIKNSVILLCLIFYSCKENRIIETSTKFQERIKKEFVIPDSAFTITTKIIGIKSFVSKMNFTAYPNPYIGLPFQLEYKEDGEYNIRYIKGEDIYYLYIRKIKNDYKAFYYYGPMESDNIKLNYDLLYYSNLPREEIRTFHPGFVMKIKQRKYKKIIIDFNENIYNLNFFNRIKFIR